jgi:hypothetical protein
METTMETEKNALEAVRTLMINTLEKSRCATQNYVGFVETTIRSIPTADADQVGTFAFRAYIERQVAANHAFVDKLLRAKDFQDAFRIQAEYFRSQLQAAVEHATQLVATMPASLNRPIG